ncbi:CAF17-like 4Fe-4S cluster assembly/insertion protein YgfZ [Actinomyces israelii]|uniref:CAF17-like 4Fe-4S cluster assembly/insertion protein YgfZ n=1 Tax=Actinomyces israelii TaxID=1659 RepID=UPI0005BD342F|nr:folate-binding protein YgfZ [Actinomyces israelii]
MRPSPLLDRAGAVPNAVGDPDEPVPAHYGDPPREQRLLEAGAAAVALARDAVAVTGPDRLSWLTTLSSQVLTDLTPGDGGVEALVLDARGRIAHALAALDDAETLWLLTEAGRGPALAEHLERMRFMLRVEVAVRDDVAALAAMGEGVARLEEAARAVPRGGTGEAALDAETPAAPDEAVPSPTAAAPATACLGVWRDPWPGVARGGTSYDVGLTRPHPGAARRAGLVLVPAGEAGAVVDAFLAAAPGRGLAGSLAWEALRVEAGRPRWAREVDERAIPHELDWLRTAVHLAKGCYPGQETVARTLNLGRPPRRLTVLQLDGLAGRLPAPGAVVRMGERAVGAVTSVARHHELGPMALALLRRGVPVDAVLTVDAEGPAGAEGEAEPGPRRAAEPVRVAAAQEPLVSPEGKAQASPAERPGAGLRRGLLR